MKKFYITTAIDYVNGPPHIGHAYEKLQQMSLQGIIDKEIMKFFS